MAHAEFLDFEKRESADIADVDYFVEQYNEFLKFTPEQMNALSEEFVEYQLMEAANIPPEVWKTAREREPENEDEKPFLRIDVMWAYLNRRNLLMAASLNLLILLKWLKLF